MVAKLGVKIFVYMHGMFSCYRCLLLQDSVPDTCLIIFFSTGRSEDLFVSEEKIIDRPRLLFFWTLEGVAYLN
jgi:hypothetical protein